MVMKKVFLTMLRSAMLMWCLATFAFGQSKIHVAAGLADVTVFGSLSTLTDKGLFEFKYKTVHLQYEKRIVGSLNALTGLTVFTAGYETSSFFFGAKSKFQGIFVSVPLMIRWNMGNKNAFYLDVGLLPIYMANAHLKESVYRFNSLYAVEGNITKYSDRFTFGTKFQMTVPINRFHFALYLQTPLSSQSSIKGLEKHWKLNSQQSTYLLSDGFSNYMIMGINLGVRIR
jgi:hypothetical protein